MSGCDARDGVKGMRVRILVHRIPIETPVQTSFGAMRDRPSVLIRVEDEDGYTGWGEVWCNYPSVGAEHRARLLEAVVLPLAGECGELESPARLWLALSARLHVLAIQTGEPGPIAQCLAGLECALQDLAARRAGEPLWRFLEPQATPSVDVYASGLNPGNAPESAGRARAAGFTACKIKIGFDGALDRENLIRARDILGPECQLMADANQAWSSTEALAFAPVADAVGLAWLEEPMPHDAPDEAWRVLSRRMTTPLAAGENFVSAADFDELPVRRRLGIVQPDLGRWGGVAQSMLVAKSARKRGHMFCPHWLGGGVGLLTSLHVKAASGGEDGAVEVDFNPNPMRSEFTRDVFTTMRDGRVGLSGEPGIGVTDAAIDTFGDHLVWSAELVI